MGDGVTGSVDELLTDVNTLIEQHSTSQHRTAQHHRMGNGEMQLGDHVNADRRWRKAVCVLSSALLSPTTDRRQVPSHLPTSGRSLCRCFTSHRLRVERAVHPPSICSSGRGLFSFPCISFAAVCLPCRLAPLHSTPPPPPCFTSALSEGGQREEGEGDVASMSLI